MKRLTRPDREPQPLREYLEASAFVGGGVQLVVALLVAALATSRADAHVLTPAALAGLLTGAAAVGVFIGWPTGLYGGAADLLAGRIVLDEVPRTWRPREGDACDGGRLWSAVGRWAIGAGAWALAGAGLVAAVLDGRRAGALVITVCLFGLAGIGGRAIDLAARRRGIDAARLRLSGDAVPLRRRAWLHFALPIAVGQLLTNAAFAWVLFHDFTVGDAYAARPLTESVALADVGTIVILLSVLLGSLAAQWGGVDAALGKVVVPEDERTDRRVGVQGLLYVAFAGMILGRLAGLVLPSTPSLLRVMSVRGLFGGVLAGAVTGFAYVRGALNRSAAGGLETGSNAGVHARLESVEVTA
jgi:hypothetical protein